MPRLSYLSEVFLFCWGRVQGEESDSTLVIKKDIGGVDIANIVWLLLKEASDFDQNVQQIPNLLLGEVLFELLPVFYDLEQRQIHLFVIDLAKMIFTVSRFLLFVFVQTRQLLS